MSLLGSLVAYGRFFEDPPMVKRGVTHLLDIQTGQLIPLTKNTELLLPAGVAQRGSNAAKKPNLFWDSPKYVCQKGTKFWERTLDVLRLCDDSVAAQAVEAFLRMTWGLNDGTFVAEGCPPVTVKNGWVTLSMGETPLVQRPKILAWCSRPPAEETSNEDIVCCVTGERGPLARTHDKVVGIGGGSDKCSFVSYNMGCVEYNGRVQGDNFHMTVKTARQYVVALNNLLNPERRSAVHLSKDPPASLLFWPEGIQSHPIIPLVTLLLGTIRNQDERSQVWAALAAVPDDDTLIHVGLLHQATGRVSVRAYLTIPVSELKRNILRFGREFDGKTALSVSQVKGVRGYVPLMSLPDYYLLFLAILTGKPYPSALLNLGSKIGSKKKIEDKRGVVFDWVDLRYLRWIEAYNNRLKPEERIMNRPTPDGELKEPEIQDYLNEDLVEIQAVRENGSETIRVKANSQAYLLGCVASLYGHLRDAAHNNQVKSSLSRDLQSAVSNPVGYVASLTKAQLYIDKLKKRRQWNLYLGVLYEDFILGVKLSTHPFSAIERPNVHLGFHHMNSYLRDLRIYKWESSPAAKAKSETTVEAAE